MQLDLKDLLVAEIVSVFPFIFALSDGFHEPVEQALIQAGNPRCPQGAADTGDEHGGGAAAVAFERRSFDDISDWLLQAAPGG